MSDEAHVWLRPTGSGLTKMLPRSLRDPRFKKYMVCCLTGDGLFICCRIAASFQLVLHLQLVPVPAYRTHCAQMLRSARHCRSQGSGSDPLTQLTTLTCYLATEAPFNS